MCAGSEESVHGVVAGDDETGEVGEKLPTKVEDDEEEVESSNADGCVSLGNASLLLKLVQGGVLGQLSRLL